jgi:hypothetical protein
MFQHTKNDMFPEVLSSVETLWAATTGACSRSHPKQFPPTRSMKDL